MKAETVMRKILDAREESGMTIQQLADASGVPKPTVERIVSGRTTNPTLQTALDLAAAVGYDHASTSAPCNPMDDPTVKHLLSLYNRQLAEKQRIIVVLGGILGILVLFVCILFLYDFIHLDRGWIQAAIHSVRNFL